METRRSAADDAHGRAHLRDLGVSRETEERLVCYADLLRRWTRTVNLVSASTRNDLWSRHILDSLQLWSLAPPATGLWLDIGTGGGLPGLVCAIMAAERAPHLEFVLVESDKRKCAFLATCLRELGITASLRPSRIEEIAPLAAGVISARAVAPLATLFSLSAPHASPETTLLLPKGVRHAEEIAVARARWRFTVEAHPSITDPEARILRCHLQGRI